MVWWCGGGVVWWWGSGVVGWWGGSIGRASDFTFHDPKVESRQERRVEKLDEVEVGFFPSLKVLKKEKETGMGQGACSPLFFFGEVLRFSFFLRSSIR